MPDREPVVEEIGLDDLHADPIYQRDPDEMQFKNMKKRIVENFDAALLHPLDVSRWDNDGTGVKNWVYDGYCRLEALRELRSRGEWRDTARCLRIEVPRTEQAELFDRQTNRRSVLWPDKHRARLAYNNPSAIEVQNVIDGLGLTIGRKGDVRAVQACYSTVEMDRSSSSPDARLRGDLLTEVLQTAGQAWSDDGTLSSGLRVQYASSDRMIDALALLLNSFTPDELNRDDLVKAMGQHYPPYLVQKSAKKTSAHGSNNRGALAAEILTLYNKLTDSRLHKGRFLGGGRRKRKRG